MGIWAKLWTKGQKNQQAAANYLRTQTLVEDETTMKTMPQGEALEQKCDELGIDTSMPCDFASRMPADEHVLQERLIAYECHQREGRVVRLTFWSSMAALISSLAALVAAVASLLKG